MNKKLKLFAFALAVSTLAFTSCKKDDDKSDGGGDTGGYGIGIHEYVDLGLPSGTLWATCNVGADSPEDYGNYYAWGETETKYTYRWSNYEWCDGTATSLTKYCLDSGYGTVDDKTVLDPEDDAAHVNWGGAWRMPTYDEMNELKDNCTSEWTTQNGVNGWKFTGPNKNSIFLPAAGSFDGASLDDAGSHGYYWSSSLMTGYPNNARYVYFNSGFVRVNFEGRCYGCSIRPVCNTR